MIWLTWRQFRLQAWFTLAALGVVAAVLAVTGPHLADLYRRSGAAGCTTDCAGAVRSFLAEAETGVAPVVYAAGIGLVFAVPALVGVFWGAPLVARELETGTYKLAWSQSITRTRWLAVKLIGTVAAGVLAAGVLSLATTWWAGPLDEANADRMLPHVFAARGIVPLGYAAFAVVVGVAAGLVLRRTVPAMAVTLVVVVAAQLVMPMALRQRLIEPVVTTAPLDTSALVEVTISQEGTMRVQAAVKQPGAWVVANRTVTASGAEFTGPYDEEKCGRDGSPQQCDAWLGTLGLRQVATFQPADRFWALQWREAGLLVAAAVVVAGFCFWWLRRRLA